VKTNFQVFKLKFHACNYSRLSILFINNISRDLDNTKILIYMFFIRYLVIKPACENAVIKPACVNAVYVCHVFGQVDHIIFFNVMLQTKKVAERNWEG